MSYLKSFLALAFAATLSMTAMSSPVLADFGVINGTAVTVNDSVVQEGIAVVRAGGSVYDTSCSCSPSGIFIRTVSGEDFIQGSFDQVTAFKTASTMYPDKQIMILDEIGNFDNTFSGGPPNDR